MINCGPAGREGDRVGPPSATWLGRSKQVAQRRAEQDGRACAEQRMGRTFLGGRGQGVGSRGLRAAAEAGEATPGWAVQAKAWTSGVGTPWVLELTAEGWDEKS